MAVWGGALLYYFIDARKWFTGPKITVDVDNFTEEQREALAAEGIDMGAGEGVVVGGGHKEMGEKSGEKDSGADST